MAWIVNFRNCNIQRLITLNVRRFSLNTPEFSKQAAIQQRWARRTERYLKKTSDLVAGINPSGKKKQQRNNANANFDQIPINVSGIVSQSSAKPHPGSERRARQLSIVFNEYITSLISSGEVCPQLVELGFEIIKVKITADLSVVNVSWSAAGGSKDDEIAKILPLCASQLRSTLTDLHLMGHIPPIQFVKDFTASRVSQVEELLKVADMGTDFEPTPLGDDLKTPFSVEDITTHASAIDELENMEYIPGPGGSFEIRTPIVKALQLKKSVGSLSNWNKAEKLAGSRTSGIGFEKACDDDGSETEQWNNTEDKEPETQGDIQPLSTGLTVKQDISRLSVSLKETNLSVPTSELMVTSTSPSSKIPLAVQPAMARPSTTELPITISGHLRSDIYGLNHSSLWQQVIHTKRRTDDRSYVRQVSGVQEQTSVLVKDLDRFTTRQVTSLLEKNRKKKERLFRNVDQLLSTHFHPDD